MSNSVAAAHTATISGGADEEASDDVRDRGFEEALRSHSAGRSLGFMLWHTTLRWQRGVDAALGRYGLTHAQFLLLTSAWWLARDGQVPNQRRVAEHAGVGEVMASQILRLLERDDLLERTTHPEDPRSKALHVTAKGRALAEEAVVALDAADERFFGEVGDPAGLLASLQLLAGRREARS